MFLVGSVSMDWLMPLLLPLLSPLPLPLPLPLLSAPPRQHRRCRRSFVRSHTTDQPSVASCLVQTVVPFYSKQAPTVALEYVNGFKQEFVTSDMEVRDLIEEISTSCSAIENEYMTKGLPVPQEDDD